MTSTSNDTRNPEPRVYSRQDLNPYKRDPQCKIPSPFPLGTFWPVYVGNFWCHEFSQHATKVQEYFASKGLLVRVVFGRNATDDPLYEKDNLYDFLVYFVRPQDADDAISYCHREMYYGHRLNVFPGRTAVNFDLSKSVKHTLVQVNKPITGQAFEQHISNVSSARLDCVVMHSWKDILVQYASVDDRNNAIRKNRLCTVDMMPAGQAKQRFLEQDVWQELLQRIRTDPWFLDMLPPDNILNALLNGSLPVCDDSWKSLNMLQMPTKAKKFTKGGNNKKKLKESAERALRLFGVECDFVRLVPDEVKEARLEKRRAKKELRRFNHNGGEDASVMEGSSKRFRMHYWK